MTEFLALKGEKNLSYEKITKQINAAAKERGLDCRKLAGMCLHRVAHHKRRRSAKARNGNDPLFWHKFAEHLNAAAKDRGLECRQFDGMSLASSFSKTRKDQSLAPEWTQVERDLVVESAVNFKRVALCQRMNETAKERGLKCRDFIKQTVYERIRRAYSARKPLQRQTREWTHVEKDLSAEYTAEFKGVRRAKQMNDLAKERNLDCHALTVGKVRGFIERLWTAGLPLPFTDSLHMKQVENSLLREVSDNFQSAVPAGSTNRVSKETRLTSGQPHLSSQVFDLRAMAEELNDIAGNEEEYDMETERGGDERGRGQGSYRIGNEEANEIHAEDGDAIIYD